MSPSDYRLAQDLGADVRRRAANEARCPLAVAARDLVASALELSLPEAAREHLEEQHAVLSDLAARGREITEESALALVEFVSAFDQD